MPALGAILMALAFCAITQRWRLAAAAAFAAVWVVGAFYYQLAWPLANKALLLIAAGALLGVLAWVALRLPAASSKSEEHLNTPLVAITQNAPMAFGRGAQIRITLSAAAVLLVANVGIWQKQNLIQNGQKIFIELAPRDPRSLMQGDYMALNFRLPSEVSSLSLTPLVSSQRPHLVVQRDARGVATPVRLDNGSALKTQELRIALTPKDGRWMLVSDAWFFREGDAKYWAAARYGEFRVTADGRALLVGMADAALRPMVAP
jgi:uncharacterized membrane-anchored protein